MFIIEDILTHPCEIVLTTSACSPMCHRVPEIPNCNC